MKVKEKSEKAGLKLNIQKTKIMISFPITLWQIDGETMETVTDFIFLGSKITAREGNGNPLQYSCVENPMDGGAWRAIVHGVTELNTTERLHFHFLSKITADGDCSHEIKRCLLLGRKAMTNLDSILKSRDITLPTKISLIKPMVFPVVMHGCESRTIKKAEHRRIDVFRLWC